MTLAVLLAGILSAPVASAPAPTPVLAGQALEFKTVDGWTLHAVWRKADEGRPTVVLLHGTGQRKEDWLALARGLEREGDGYAAVDLRGHGESRISPTGETVNYKKLSADEKGPNDFEDMTRDVEALVTALKEQGVVEGSIGLAGAEVGGSLTIKYAAVHPQVPFLVVLSPGLRWQEVLTVNALRAFKGRTTPILMVYSEADKRSSKEAPLMYAFAKNAVGENNVTAIVVPQERGTRLLRRNRGLTARIVAWIANPRLPPVAPSTAPVPSPESPPGADGDAL